MDTPIDSEKITADRLVTKKRVAARLSISTRTVDRLCQKGALQRIYVNGSVRFRFSDVERIIQQGC